MGVTGLLQHLKEIQEPATLEKYRGKTLAIDSYGWLHRGLISCAQELCQDVPTRKYITSIMKKVGMLRHFGVEPYFVFDGAALPTKAETVNERRSRREEARKKADEYSKKGNRRLAWKEYMKAACVTCEMAKSIMIELDNHNIKYVVAPYEADPQMVYLEKIGAVDGILSEDSDLLIFGCNRLITKLKDDATCVEICRENFSNVKKIPYLASYTQEQLRLVAMLSGCDYTKGIPNIGLKTAFSLVRKYNNLDKILNALRADGKKLPDDFKDEVNRANLAFQYQKVFNPSTQELQTLNNYSKDLDLDLEIIESCCGQTFTNDIWIRVCNGHIHPRTHQILVSREQSLTSLKSNSVNLGSINTTKVLTRSRRTISATMPLKPKTGLIDSFFSSVTKTKTISIPLTPSNSNKRVHVPEKSKLKGSLSPTSKKMKKIIDKDEIFVSPNRKISKFFSNSNETPPTKQKSLPTPSSCKPPTWDSSLIADDSDIPDEFSSPVNYIKASKSQSQAQPEVTTTENVLVELTDDDKDELESDKDEIAICTPGKLDSLSCKKKTKDRLGDFDIDDEDDEIDESPVRTRLSVRSEQASSPKLLKFVKVLRENFSYNSSYQPSTNKVSQSIDKYARKPLTNLTIDSKFNKSRLNDRSSSDKLNINIKSTFADITYKAKDENIQETKSKEDTVSRQSPEQNNPPVTVQTRRSISLQSFAFKG